MSRFAATLTAAQLALARRFERAGLCSISSAVRAFERKEEGKIEMWKRQLTAIVNEQHGEERE